MSIDNSLSLNVQETGTIASPAIVQYTHSHLKFRLGRHLTLLPTRQILEVITVPAASVTPMPNMPPAMLGLINRRSQVMWVTDLALLLGIPVAYPNSQQYNLVLLQVNQVLLGLRVQEIDNILNLPHQEVCPPPAHVPAGLVPFLRGCYVKENDVLLVLNAEAILHAPALKAA
ncbi:chemotaxis protein CheW [Oscillatoria sp. CS-180]|uniref:chemotaxis protein CheW n=1 Tax=Oscillatoria sp. CS-180 TaxID=3021720 RepID=UPI0023308744|nr:chemotaxis protein CheW [Oscillatoria sp. CS-180]MDB9526333.1 chemotaxis protein CheW [Oscillatoria sp. CS-180]